MSQKLVVVPEIGEVILSKRRGSKSLRLSIAPTGQVRVGMPHWLPYSAGVSFAKKKADWINLHLKSHEEKLLFDGCRIGKSLTLNYEIIPSDKPIFKSRLFEQSIEVKSSYRPGEAAAQKKLKQVCERALKKEANVLLTHRLKQLSLKYRLDYNSLKIKKLTSRWGSCSSGKAVVLSYYLIQLPWEFIDFVILHELTHTRYLNHSKKFWGFLDGLVPHARQKQKALKQYKPRLQPW